MRSRTIVCPCEDVELWELDEAVERGYTDLEAVKRLTAVTTGPCQGKFCLRATIEHLAQATAREPGELGAITHRAPVHGVPLGALAGCPTGDPAVAEDAEQEGPGHEAVDEPADGGAEGGDP